MKPYILLWIPMIVLAIINGTAREFWLNNHFEELTAHQISTVTLLLLFAIYFYIIFKKHPIQSTNQSFKIGLLWMVLTLIFEFSFSFFSGLTLNEILSEYNVLHGKTWILIPLWLFIAPRIYYSLIKND